MSEQRPGDHFEHPQRPTTDQPIGGPRRSTLKPLLLTVVVFAILIAGYLIASGTVLSAD